MDRIGRRWPAYAGVVPWALLVLGIVMDLATPKEVSGGPLIVLACVASGVIMSFRATLRLVLVAFLAELLTGSGSPARPGPSSSSTWRTWW
ncbi:hypothetical protein ACH4K5_04780 [Streptomyces albidoflavus]